MRSESRTDALNQSGASHDTLLRWMAVPGFTMFNAVCAQIAFPMPPYGIPQTLQTLAVLLCALALGPLMGSLSMIVYLLAGAVGVGVFAEGESGWQTIIGQSGGYLVGFILCQPIAHAIIRRRPSSSENSRNTFRPRTRTGEFRGWGAVILAGIAVHAVVFSIGVPWLYFVRSNDALADPLTVWDAIKWGCIAFLPGMVLKVGIATVLAVIFRPEIARRFW